MPFSGRSCEWFANFPVNHINDTDNNSSYGTEAVGDINIGFLFFVKVIFSKIAKDVYSLSMNHHAAHLSCQLRLQAMVTIPLFTK